MLSWPLKLAGRSEIDLTAHFLETFSLATWVEHEREQVRRTNADAQLHDRARSYAVDGVAPEVVRYVGSQAHRRQQRHTLGSTTRADDLD